MGSLDMRQRVLAVGILLFITSCVGTQRRDAPSPTRGFDDDFICNLPGRHNSYWCDFHNKCHVLGASRLCDWTAECQPPLPFVVGTVANKGSHAARIAEVDCTVTLAKPGDLIGPGLRITGIRQSVLTVEVTQDPWGETWDLVPGDWIRSAAFVYPIAPWGDPSTDTSWQKRVVPTVHYVGSEDNLLVIDAAGPVLLELVFTNVTSSPRMLQVCDSHSYEGELPYPAGLAVRTEYADGTIHPVAAENKEWWSQYMMSGTLFSLSDRSTYELQPQESHRATVDLADVLAVPAGGPPPGWPIRLSGHYRPGEYTLSFRYEGWESQELRLIVKPTKSEPTSKP